MARCHGSSPKEPESDLAKESDRCGPRSVPPEVQPAALGRRKGSTIIQTERSLCHALSSLRRPGGPEVLEFLETEVPAPGPTEVRIKVKAIGINRAESMWRTDVYIEPVVKYPAGLGYEAAGLVDAVGRDVRGVALGDEVNVIPSFSLNQYHTSGEVVLVPDYAVVKHPKSLSFAEAASIWMMFVTAYGALIEDAKVNKGDFVLVPAASSSVGLAAIQIANYAGATSIALTRTSAKRKQLIEAGAAHVIATEAGLFQLYPRRPVAFGRHSHARACGGVWRRVSH